MSCWTKIRGYVEVEPFGRTQEEKEFILKTVLNHLPLVSGSESRMNTVYKNYTEIYDSIVFK